MAPSVISIHIDAFAERVWEVLMAVEAYPEWTPSMTRVERVGGMVGADLAVGDRVRITQPRLGTMIWTVSEVEPPRRFGWVAVRGTVSFTGTHTITRSDSGVDLELGLEQRGFGAALAARLTRSLTRRYITLEA